MNVPNLKIYKGRANEMQFMVSEQIVLWAKRAIMKLFVTAHIADTLNYD